MTNKVYQVPYGTKDILPGEMKTLRGYVEFADSQYERTSAAHDLSL